MRENLPEVPIGALHVTQNFAACLFYSNHRLSSFNLLYLAFL